MNMDWLMLIHVEKESYSESYKQSRHSCFLFVVAKISINIYTRNIIGKFFLLHPAVFMADEAEEAAAAESDGNADGITLTGGEEGDGGNG